MSAADKVDVAVIGAGIVGLAVARALSMAGREVLVLEKHGQIGSETSSRNSQVIHAGLYYKPPTSYKAKWCVKGKQMMYDYCREQNVAHQQIGKLLVATNEHQLNVTLPRLYEQAMNNGVDDVRIMSQDDCRELEPQVQCLGALWSPSTGILDAHELVYNLCANAEDHGATLALHTEISNAKYTRNDGLQINAGDNALLSCNAVVNCAGLYADRIANLFHPNDWKPPKQYFAKGNYFKLSTGKNAAPFSHLIYPVPDDSLGGLGTHATLNLAGQVTFGPDVQWLPINNVKNNKGEIASNGNGDYTFDYRPDESRKEAFAEAIRTYWPDLPGSHALTPDYTGIRPKLHHPDQRIVSDDNPEKSLLYHDFAVLGPNEHRVPNLVHLLGIESPGLTCALAIGEHVKNMLSS